MVLGFANGAFDGLHDGHKHFLRSCMLNCSTLMVALNTDLSVQRKKGGDRPRHKLIDRMAEVQAFLRKEDFVGSFETEGELAEMIQRNGPHVLFKGEDYIGKAVTGAGGIRIHWIARHPAYSTTALEELKREYYERGWNDADKEFH